MSGVLVDIYLSFFKIGLFGFGGGYAMISLIQAELVNRRWIRLEEFIDIIAIAQMTPGPIAINSGTFVGYRVSTIFGSLVATIAVITPSFILVLILARYFHKVKDSNFIKNLLRYLRPTVIGLIVAAAITIAKTNVVDIRSLIILIAVILIMYKTEAHPILVIMLAGLSGAVIYA